MKNVRDARGTITVDLHDDNPEKFLKAGGKLARNCNERIGGVAYRHAAHGHRPAGTGTIARAHNRRVALDDGNTIRRRTEAIGGDLGVTGLVALPARHRADANLEAATVGDDLGRLVEGNAIGLDGQRKANAPPQGRVRHCVITFCDQ